MRERDRRKTGPGIRAWMLAAMVVLSGLWTGRQVSAAETTGRIKLELPAEAEGVEMTLYRIGETENGAFLYSGDFAECGIELPAFDDAAALEKAAKELGQYAAAHAGSGQKKQADGSGEMTYEDLEPGLYLLAQTAGEELLEVEATLLSLPEVTETGEERYEITATPKYTFSGGAVIIHKTDEQGKGLGQAVFSLYQKTYLTETEPSPETGQTEEDETGTYYWKELPVSLVSDDNGQIVMTDLPKAVYRLVETQAPAGFRLLDTPAEFTIRKAGQVKEIDGIYSRNTGQVEEVTVVNVPAEVTGTPTPTPTGTPEPTETSTPTLTPAPTGGNPGGGNPSGGGTTSTSGVKTGDDAPIASYLLLMGGAVMMLLIRRGIRKKTR